MPFGYALMSVGNSTGHNTLDVPNVPTIKAVRAVGH